MCGPYNLYRQECKQVVSFNDWMYLYGFMSIHRQSYSVTEDTSNIVLHDNAAYRLPYLCWLRPYFE